MYEKPTIAALHRCPIAAVFRLMRLQVISRQAGKNGHTAPRCQKRRQSPSHQDCKTDSQERRSGARIVKAEPSKAEKPRHLRKFAPAGAAAAAFIQCLPAIQSRIWVEAMVFFGV